jgi:hypothetical protein
MSWRRFFLAEQEVERKYWVPIRNFSLPRGSGTRIPILGVVIRDAARPHAGVRQRQYAAASTQAAVRREIPNYWHAITRLGCGCSANASAPTSSRPYQHHLAKYEPRRRACLAFACLVCRPLRRGDLGIICALMAKARSRNLLRRHWRSNVSCCLQSYLNLLLTMFGTPSNLTFWTCVGAIWNPSPHSSR